MQVITPIPHDVYLALSGGIDSMFALHFLNAGRRKVHCLFFDHGTSNSLAAKSFLLSQDIKLTIGSITRNKYPEESPEEYWRNERYNFFSNFSDKKIIMGHNLNDQAENWLMTSLHGTPRLIPYANHARNIIRPFIMVSRKEIEQYCRKHTIQWSEDLSNLDVNYNRNKIRHEVLPKCLEINPGFLTVIRKNIERQLPSAEKF